MASEKEQPPLSLVPEEEIPEDRTDSTKYCTFKLFTSPAAAAAGGANANTSKYSFTMMKVDGTQSIRHHLKWYRDIGKVFAGLNIDDVDAQLPSLA